MPAINFTSGGLSEILCPLDNIVSLFLSSLCYPHIWCTLAGRELVVSVNLNFIKICFALQLEAIWKTEVTFFIFFCPAPTTIPSPWHHSEVRILTAKNPLLNKQ